MSTPTTEELLARIEHLQAQVDTLGAPGTNSRRRGVRLALSVVTLAALLAVPIGVFASHQFTDVPDSNTFHTQIGRVKGAGITAGCTATKYCPDDTVSRGQMAAFLARTGGRIDTAGEGQAFGPVISNSFSSPTSLGTVTIKAGDVTGGYATVQLIGTATIFASSATGLPSYAEVFIREVGTTAAVSSRAFPQVDGLSSTFGTADGAVIGSVTVPTGVAKSYEIVAYRVAGTGTLSGFAAISATYIPFAGDGTNAIPPAAPAPAPKPDGKPSLSGH